MIGIHNNPGSFSDRWLELCRQRSLPFKVLDCRASDIVQQCSSLSAVLWHWSHNELGEPLIARQVLAALRNTGLVVFPTAECCRLYDDKIAQKYALEAIGAPLVPTWVFVDRAQAESWIARASWPKVFKLRCGAGSSNVRLVRTRSAAQALCARAFGAGFASEPGYFRDLQTRSRNAATWALRWQKLRRAPRNFLSVWRRRRALSPQRGYVYLQEFLPGNSFDTRVTVIGDRAFGFRRMNRAGDFRASGSGRVLYDPQEIDCRALQIGFEVARGLGSRSLALDFLHDAEGRPRLTEVSYCYVAAAVHACPGHWDPELVWHPGQVWPQDAILEDVLHGLPGRNSPVPKSGAQSPSQTSLPAQLT